jgi:hypothetical protein
MLFSEVSLGCDHSPAKIESVLQYLVWVDAQDYNRPSLLGQQDIPKSALGLLPLQDNKFHEVT